MCTLGDGALQARIIGIAREQSDELRLALETSIVGVEVAKGLEAGDAAYGFRGTASGRWESWVRGLILKLQQEEIHGRMLRGKKLEWFTLCDKHR